MGRINNKSLSLDDFSILTLFFLEEEDRIKSC